MAIALVVFNTVLFAGLASYALVMSARTRSRSVRRLWQLVSLPAVVVTAGGLHRTAIQAARLDWLPEERLGPLLDEWQMVKSAAVAVIGIGAVVGMRRLAGRVADLESLVGEVLDRAQQVDLASLDLTPRERQVLGTIGTSPRIDDKTLAEKLTVSPATAHTHVRALLRKAKLRDRRDLVVLAFLLKTRRGLRLPHAGEASTPRT